ncbi:glycosyltransferase family 9 protein [Rouxiella sp. Mn2063]|uniref:glycosyltransferase family 9 protein n=1 Tax=Rouxiella sp. Mn2063 TaxID=3395262 RepID=UPI003BCECA35
MKNILIIRRDNIGDLVCTMPLIEGVKNAFPDAKVYLLINSVSKDVVKNNPHIEKTFVYKKAKHRAKNQSALSVYLERIGIFLKLRQIRFDAAILANPVPCKYSLRLAKMAGVKNIIGAELDIKGLNYAFKDSDFSGEHQVERTFSYLKAISPLPIPIPGIKVYPDAEELLFARQQKERLLPNCSEIYGVHISNRRPKSRWPIEYYAEVIKRITKDSNKGVFVFWSPQGTLAPDDVGDQVLAEKISELCGGHQVALYPTASVRELIGGFSLCRMILCSDGGQMHLASALEKDTVVFFGETDPAAWRPWSGNTHILKPATGESSDISVDEAWEAISTML